ncbi:HepT-like ribonuclease domain-containing protein [Gordonia sp. NPDC003424]
MLDRLDDLVEYCGEAQQLVDDGKPVLLTQWRQQRAAEAVVGRIGEAASHLPAEFRTAYPGQPWDLVIGIRIVVDDRYRSLDYHQVWTALEAATPLRRYIEVDILGTRHGV